MSYPNRRFVAAILLGIMSLKNARAIRAAEAHTIVTIVGQKWHINGQVTYAGSSAEGRLLNVRMVNAVFEDANPQTNPAGFDPDSNTNEFIRMIPDYVSHGVRAFTICLQGGMPGYEGAVNTAFNRDGSLRDTYLERVKRVIEACDRNGVVVILGCYYQRQSNHLRDADAIRSGVVNAARWIHNSDFRNVVLEIANEYPHGGFAHSILRSPEGIAELIRLAKQTSPGLPVSASGLGDGKLHDSVAEASDFLLVHSNGTGVQAVPARIAALRRFGKPIVCNEDDKTGGEAARAAEAWVSNGASWGLMLSKMNQYVPFHFHGADDDPAVYSKLNELSTAPARGVSTAAYFPPPESHGGWRQLSTPDEIQQLGGMSADRLAELRDWLLNSDDRDFAAVVVRHGYITLEVERGNSAKTDSRRVASVSKAICATVLAIASERSKSGELPHTMRFDDPAFQFIPWAHPLSDPRKARITVKQLLNHTSGICPEAIGAPNDGSWEYILGLSGDKRTSQLSFDPGTACGYSTHALSHASLVCETVTGQPYDQFAIESLFKPIGVEHWWFQYFDGGEMIGRHPSHGVGMPARDLARIAYCMLHDGRWNDCQVIPRWFVGETIRATHDVKTPELRWKLNPEIFSHGWELPALHSGPSGRSGVGIPHDARSKPGSGGQLIAFVPSLDLVVTRQTGSSGDWEFEEYLRRACAAALP